MQPIAIIVPCYNEANRMKVLEFIAFANKHQEVQFYFVNDGSTDNTENIILHIQQSSTAKIVSFKKNYGKAEAIRKGLIAALNDQHEIVGYLDADLSTGLNEFLRLKKILDDKKLDIVLGSRIKKIDTVIERSFFRHIVGRIIATIIDQKFKLGVYDTQCGAKIFRSTIIKNMLEEKLHTKWFFDVELLLRTRDQCKNFIAAEVPLSEWKNVQNSKLSILSFPSVLKDLFMLFHKY